MKSRPFSKERLEEANATSLQNIYETNADYHIAKQMAEQHKPFDTTHLIDMIARGYGPWHDTIFRDTKVWEPWCNLRLEQLRQQERTTDSLNYNKRLNRAANIAIFVPIVGLLVIGILIGYILGN